MSARSIKKEDAAKQPPASAEPPHPAKDLLWARPGFLIRRLHQIHVAMFLEEFKSQNITPVQYGLLTAVAAVPDLDQTSLGQEVGLDRTTTADVVKRLEDRRLLEPLRPAERAMLMHLMQVLVEANNQYSRTVLRTV